jgi:hypothetical protein
MSNTQEQGKFTLKGEITEIKDPQTNGNFTKREFCLKYTDGKYPQEIKLEVTNQKVSELDNYEVGDKIEVYFNLRGNRSKAGSVYNNLTAWKFVQLDSNMRPMAGENTRTEKDWTPSRNRDASDDDLTF